jgi:hypothetical protein
MDGATHISGVGRSRDLCAMHRPRLDKLFDWALQIRNVIARDSNELPSIRASAVEHVEFIASRSLFAEIDLSVFPYRYSSHLLPYQIRVLHTGSRERRVVRRFRLVPAGPRGYLRDLPLPFRR